MFGWLLSRPPEPSFKNRKLGEWVQDISPTMLPRQGGGNRSLSVRIQPQTTVISRDDTFLPFPWGGVVSNAPKLFDIRAGASVATYPPQHEAAANAIRQMGAKAIPHLLRAIYSRDGKLKETCVKWSEKQNLVKLRFATAEQKQCYALPALRELGPLALWAWVEVATNRLASPGVQAYAARRLVELRAVQPIMAVENHPDSPVRIIARSALAVMPAAADRVVRATEMWSLGFMRDDPDKTIPVLVAALDDASPLVRQEALLAIAKFGADAITATNAIQRMMEDPERGVRSTATNVLKQVLQGKHSIQPR